MTNEELARLIYSGQNELLGELYLQNIRLIHKYAHSFYNRHLGRCSSCGVEYNDLIQQAYLVFMEAVNAYNKSLTEYRFATFLKYPLQNCFNNMIGFITKKSYHEPINNTVSLEMPVSDNDGDGLTLLDVVKDTSINIENEIAERLSYDGMLRHIKETLKERPMLFDILIMRYVHEMTFERIGERLHCPTLQVRNSHDQALRILRKSPLIRRYCPVRVKGMDMQLYSLREVHYE